MRFFLDEHVDTAVLQRLTALGHDAWTVANANLSGEGDDELTVYADEMQAVLITHDHEFSKRRRTRVVGWHVYLRCNEWDAADVLADHLDDLLELIRPGKAIYVELSKTRLDTSRRWE